MAYYGSNGPTADDIELFGQDLVDFAQRAAAPVVQQRTASLEQRLQQTEAALREQRIVAALDADSVTRDRWRAVNQSDDFLRWLAEVYELTGSTRMSHLRQAEASGNTIAVVNLFRTWILLGMHGRVPSERLPYENAPRTPAPSDSTRSWSRKNIARFYEDCRKGKYRNNEAGRARIEREIHDAVRAGRIVDLPMALTRGFAADLK